MPNFLDIFRSRKEVRGNPFDNPNYPMTEMNVNAFLDSFGGQNRSDSGETVNILTSLQVSTVWACVNLISQQIAINPFNVYQLDGSGNKTEAINHDYFDLVTNNPNPEMDSISFRTAVQFSTELTGNGYIEIQRDNGGRVVALWHRASERTHPFRMSNGVLAYQTTDSESREPRIIRMEDMIHIKGATLNGLVALNPLEFFRGPIGSKLAMDKYSARFFANNATPSGILSMPATMKVRPEDKPKMRADWESQMHGGNQHRINILDQGATFTPITIAQNDAQFLETKTEIAKEIAAFFGVQGYAVGLLDKGIKANVEQQAQDLYNYCLRPRMAKWEKAFSTKLFSSKGRSAGRYITHFDVFKLLHPDDASIQVSIQSSVQNGVITPNEGRSWLGLNNDGDPSGNRRYIQLNMQTLENANAVVPAPSKPDTELALEQEENSRPIGIDAQYRDWFVDSMSRFMKRDVRDAKSARQCLLPVLESMTATLKQGNSNTSLSADEETVKAIEKYTNSLVSKSTKWSGDPNEVIAVEFNKVIRTLVFSIESGIAKQRATERLKELQGDGANEADQE